MRRHFNAATAVLVALSTITLSACGPDDGTSASANQSSATADAATPPVTQPVAQLPPQFATQSPTQPAAPASPPSIPSGASAALSSTPDDVTDIAVQNVEASLAADSQQVPPVMHFAPGDSDPNSSRN
ncbi:MAG: hypothetical protein WCA85_13255 [Paraburkholderia sp.]|uniref:hypothetical protein n=1 Tax=Paraburkholderia sp. TaxID=1926495 RepID=UPI003C680105